MIARPGCCKFDGDALLQLTCVLCMCTQLSCKAQAQRHVCMVLWHEVLAWRIGASAAQARRPWPTM
jgi:hypothetical protein